MIRSVKDLEIWRNAVGLAMMVFEKSKLFPREEMYSLTDQIRRSSRSVAANISEGWHKRRYPASFISKFSDAECEAGETLTWIEFARRCGYWEDAVADELDQRCTRLISQIVGMINHADDWCGGISAR